MPTKHTYAHRCSCLEVHEAVDMQTRKLTPRAHFSHTHTHTLTHHEPRPAAHTSPPVWGSDLFIFFFHFFFLSLQVLLPVISFPLCVLLILILSASVISSPHSPDSLCLPSLSATLPLPLCLFLFLSLCVSSSSFRSVSL